MGSVAIAASLQWGDNVSLCCNWNPMCSNANTSSLDKLVSIFTWDVLGTIGQFNTYLFWLSLIQRLMSLGQNQISHSTLLMEGASFSKPFVCWCKGAMFACFDFCILQSPCIGLHCPQRFDRVGWQSCNVPLWKEDNLSQALMWYVSHHALQVRSH